ncbi:MAG: hypothetical protein HN509_12470 [Halobacteriovoraceae bacterium]|jgi:hypothetical protein|nr:hypothetical protein [Halobacteriovoraceae bacterium]MBT5095589.1 hypothetical protein [Halobacteriovoraceae bacterium]
MIKILIKAPLLEEDVISSFPFIHKVLEIFEEPQLNIICEQGQEGLFEFLPEKINVFPITKEQKNVFGIHKFANSTIDAFNIELFLDLEMTFLSAFIGHSFKAKERVSYVNSLNKLLLTQSFEAPSELRKDTYYLNLLENHLKTKFEHFKIVGNASEEPPENFFHAEEPGPFIMVVLENLIEKSLFWEQLFNKFEEQRFMIWDFSASLEIQDFVKNLPSKNQYLYRKGSHSEFSDIVIHSKGVLCNQIWCGQASSYLGVSSFIWTTQVGQVPFIEYFKTHPHLIEHDYENVSKIIGPEESSTPTDLNQVVDYLHLQMKL